MSKQTKIEGTSEIAKINFLVVALIAGLLISIFERYTNAQSLESSRSYQVSPSIRPTIVPSIVIPPVKQHTIVYPSIVPTPSQYPSPSPTPYRSPITYIPIPTYKPCIIGIHTYDYLTDEECQKEKIAQVEYDELIMKQEQIELQQQQIAIDQEKVRIDAYNSCLQSATQRAYVICGSLNTCDSTGEGGFDTILNTERAKCQY
jgi:hypothetical protein